MGLRGNYGLWSNVLNAAPVDYSTSYTHCVVLKNSLFGFVVHCFRPMHFVLLQMNLAHQVQREHGLWNKAVRVRVLLQVTIHLMCCTHIQNSEYAMGSYTILYYPPTQRLLDPVNSHQLIGKGDMEKAAGKFNVRGMVRHLVLAY